MEWNYNLDEIPKDGRLIIGLVKDTELGMSILSYKDQCIPWESNNGNYHTEDIAAWMPAPEVPKKKHECVLSGACSRLICKTYGNDKFMIELTKLTGASMYRIVNFCPICGEKAGG